MSEWWQGLSLLSQIFAISAIPATIIMIIQSVMLLFGFGFGQDADADGEIDIESDTDGLSLITIRGLVAFFSVGGWTGMVADSGGLPEILSIIIAFAVGLASLIGIALLFRLARNMQYSGNLNIAKAIGKKGTVYIPIPKKGEGRGKISILLQDRLIEVNAITQNDRVLKTGESVVVMGIIDSGTVLVDCITELKAQNNGESILNNSLI